MPLEAGPRIRSWLSQKQAQMLLRESTRLAVEVNMLTAERDYHRAAHESALARIAQLTAENDRLRQGVVGEMFHVARADAVQLTAEGGL